LFYFLVFCWYTPLKQWLYLVCFIFVLFLLVLHIIWI